MNMIAYANSLLQGPARPVPTLRATPADWAADYLGHHLTGLTLVERRRLVAHILLKVREGALLTDLEQRVHEAFLIASRDDGEGR